MISSKQFQYKFRDIPATWTFEFYCKLPEKLSGDSIKIRSPLNEEDSTPSFCIYFDVERKDFRYKCFSTGSSGDHLDFVKALFKFNHFQASNRLIKDYLDYIHKNAPYQASEFAEQHISYKVTSYEPRKWTTADGPIWTPFNISSKILERFNVKGIASYEMEKAGNPKVVIKGPQMYGYFKQDGSLYKIYQPKNKERKFIKVDTWCQNYLQGSEQLVGHKLLVIESSLKDIMSLSSLKLKVDYIAPDSENVMIAKTIVDNYRQTYPCIGVMLDNDAAGIKAMVKYREELGLTPLLLPMSKDPSDSIRDNSPAKVRNRIVPLFNNFIDRQLMAA